MIKTAIQLGFMFAGEESYTNLMWYTVMWHMLAALPAFVARWTKALWVEWVLVQLGRSDLCKSRPQHSKPHFLSSFRKIYDGPGERLFVQHYCGFGMDEAQC